MDPGGVALLVTVTVGLVVHDLAGTHALLVVDLPENDAAVLGTTKAVAGCRVAQLAIGEIAGGDGGFTELRI